MKNTLLIAGLLFSLAACSGRGSVAGGSTAVAAASGGGSGEESDH